MPALRWPWISYQKNYLLSKREMARWYTPQGTLKRSQDMGTRPLLLMTSQWLLPPLPVALGDLETRGSRRTRRFRNKTVHVNTTYLMLEESLLSQFLVTELQSTLPKTSPLPLPSLPSSPLLTALMSLSHKRSLPATCTYRSPHPHSYRPSMNRTSVTILLQHVPLPLLPKPVLLLFSLHKNQGHTSTFPLPPKFTPPRTRHSQLPSPHTTTEPCVK